MGTMNYAVIKTGAKQYLVSADQKLKIEKLPGEVGSTITFDEVLMTVDGPSVNVGAPMVKGAKVTAKITRQGRDKKILVVKYKPKVRYRKKQGHRQEFTEVEITNLV